MDSHGPKPFFDTAFTLLLVEEAEGAVNDFVAKNFLFFCCCCCLLFLTWYFSTYLSRKAGTQWSFTDWPCGCVTRSN